MANRLSKIVTRTGDQGETGLADGSRCKKNELRIQCLGEIDELNSTIGLMNAHIDDQTIQQLIIQIQHDLFDLGAELSQPGQSLMSEKHVFFIDEQIELYNAQLDPLKEFILPGGSACLGFTHLARSVARRSERQLVALHQQEAVNTYSLQYLNRLSDLLFILARYIAKQTDTQEIFWQSKYSRMNKS